LRMLAGILVLALAPAIASSHHAFPETFNTSRVVEVYGEVVALRWENPHVQLAVLAATGERWEIESNAIGGLERRGVMVEHLALGTELRIAGFPARNGDLKMYSSNVQFSDGTEVVLRPGSERRWTTE